MGDSHLSQWDRIDRCGSGRCQRALASWVRATNLPGQQRSIEKRWREFFSDPSQWWDHRLDKTSTTYPDFRHKKTQEGLWVKGTSNPKWVEAEITAMAPGAVNRNPFSWNVNLATLVKGGQYQKALELFKEMQRMGMEPDLYTFIPVLNACANLGALQDGRSIHEKIIQCAYELDMFVGTGLVHMYAKCQSLEDALRVFNKMPTRTVVSWNAIIGGHVKFGQGQKALKLARQMQAERVKPDPVTFVAILTACSSIAELEEGKRVHKQIIQCGYAANLYVGSSLVYMYSICGSIDDAWKVFSKMPRHDLVAWNSMIGGYVKCGQGERALDLFTQMQVEQVQPDPVTFVGVLNACASVAALEKGRKIHAQIIHNNACNANKFVRNALVDMYAKCGSIEDALQAFNEMMPTCDVVAWNTMLGGYAIHGQGSDACQLFERMCQGGIELNRVTFVCLLSACSHAGLVDEGAHFFESMSKCHGISATVDHNASMVDLLGRAGRLHEAEDKILAMLCEPDVVVWQTLLGACRMHGNLEMGERVARIVLEMGPGSSAGYVLLSNIYASAGKWDSSAKAHKMRMEQGVKKQPGCTWIEVNNQMHSFIVGDQEHPQIAEIRAELKGLNVQLEEVGYVPDTRSVLHDVDKDEKEFRLCHHSEKLAIAFGLMSTPPGTPLYIFKNLRVCDDCHTATKLITMITRRLIIMRDCNRFHHFKDGLCSCGDYW